MPETEMLQRDQEVLEAQPRPSAVTRVRIGDLLPARAIGGEG
jgi:hypothetical protein